MPRPKRKASRSPVAGEAKKLRLYDAAACDEGVSDVFARDGGTSVDSDGNGDIDDFMGNDVGCGNGESGDDSAGSDGESDADSAGSDGPEDHTKDVLDPKYSGPALTVARLRILRSCYSGLGPSEIDDDDCWSCSMAGCPFSFRLDSLHETAPALILDETLWSELDWTDNELSAQLQQYAHVFATGHMSFLERGFGVGEDGVDWLMDDNRTERLEFACLQWRLCAVQLLHYAGHFPNGSELSIAKDLVLAAKECFTHLIEYS